MRWGPFRHACLTAGIIPGVWFTEGGNIVNTPGDARFAIAELEGPGDYDGIKLAIDQGRLPTCPKAVVTNFNHPIYPSSDLAAAQAAAAPLIGAGFACLTEAYMGENPNATPANMDRLARTLGWPRSQPVYDVYKGTVPDRSWPGSSDYLAEYVL